MNSTAKHTPAARPASSVPSRSNSRRPRSLHQPATSKAATIERMVACTSGGMSWIASLVATWLKPQDKQSTTMIAAASASSGRVTLLDAGADTINATSRRLAMRADAGNFDHRRLRRKSGGARGGLDGVGDRGAGRLAHGAAFFADQEHHRIAGFVILHAGDECVAAFDAMDQALFAQEFERAVNGDRRRARAAHCQPVDQFIGAERLMACQQRLEHAAADRSQAFAPRRAYRLGVRDGIAGTTAMVVARRREYRTACHLSRQRSVCFHAFKSNAIKPESRKGD